MSPEPVHGRLFGPEIAAAGVACTGTLDALRLTLRADGLSTFSISLSEVTLRRAGFNDTQLQFGWRRLQEDWAFLIDDADLIRRLERSPPEGLREGAQRLASARRKQRRLAGLGLSAVGLWLALPLLALVALVLAARPLSGWLAGFVSVQHETQLGDWFFSQQRSRLKLIEGTAANDALDALGRRLSEGSRYTYRWHIAEDASLNAFAIPGGIIVVHSGLMLAADDASELAGVLAHEIEHVELRHSLKAMVQQAGLRLAVAAVIGDFGIAGQAAGQLSGLSFSRDSEREADALGLQRLVAHGIDPNGMRRMFSRFAAAEAAAPPAWMSSHPGTAERIETIDAALNELPKITYPPLDLDWDSVKASLSPG